MLCLSAWSVSLHSLIHQEANQGDCSDDDDVKCDAGDDDGNDVDDDCESGKDVDEAVSENQETDFKRRRTRSILQRLDNQVSSNELWFNG